MYDVVRLADGVVVEECFTLDWACIVVRCHASGLRGWCVIVHDGEVIS